MEMSKGVSLLRTAQSLLTGRTIYSYQYIVIQESKPRIFDFHIFQERQKNKKLLLGVSYIAESQTGLYLVISKLTVIGVLNFQ